MVKFRVLLTSCAFVLIGLNSASALLPSPAYVDAKNGVVTGTCPITAPCLTLNYALSQISAGGQIIFLTPGVFGSITLTGSVSMTGSAPDTAVEIVADGSPPGCIGASAGSCGTNNGYAVEIAAAATDGIKISHVLMSAGSSGNGALKFTSGGTLYLSYNVYRGNASASAPIVSLYPTNSGTTQAQVYFSNSDIGFNANGGAIECKPNGNTSLKLHFNHVEVHNAAFGIRTDGTLLSGPSAVVATFISESEFFSFQFAAVNAVSTSGTGTVNAAFNTVNILNAQFAINSNGPQTAVVLTNSTIAGNGFGTRILSGGTIYTSQNNTIKGNGMDVSGALTPAPLQ
jgi:hypothetical protein